MTRKGEQKQAEEQVAEATKLNREIKEKTARVELLKTSIRMYATKVSLERPIEKRNEKVEIESKEGTATIAFPKEEVSLAKGADPYVIHEELSLERWESLFEEKAVLKSEFDERLKHLPADDRKRVEGLIERKTPEPRVNLAK